jgi:hypothetical protein
MGISMIPVVGRTFCSGLRIGDVREIEYLFVVKSLLVSFWCVAVTGS